MFGITFTPTALIEFETMLADKAEPVVDDIAKKLASSDGAVHTDETYWTADGAREDVKQFVKRGCNLVVSLSLPVMRHRTRRTGRRENRG